MQLERRSQAVSYLLWALGLVGVCGLQRFYNRKPLSGTLWLISLGFCGIGQLVDLFLIPELVAQANQPLLLEEALSRLDGVEASQAIDRQLLALARRSGPAGFTFNDALLELSLPAATPRERIREEIERLLFDNLLDVDNDERGRVIYREP
ncbi:MAG: NINE protein [Prochlorococcaceae cyanobacterium]